MTSRFEDAGRSTTKVISLPPFQRLLDAHSGVMIGLITASVGRQDAEDCFQEAVLAALRAYPQVTDNSNLRSWLLTIAHRKAIDHHRAASRRPAPSPIPDLAAPATETDPDLWDAVAALPPAQSQAVRLRFLDDLRYRDIASSLGCSEEAARRRVHDGVANLREVVDR